MDDFTVSTFLGELLDNIEAFQTPHTPREHIVQLTQRVPSWPKNKQLPTNIDDFPLLNFIKSSVKSNEWGYSTATNQGLLLKFSKLTEKSYLNLDLVRKYMIDDSLKGKKLKCFADFCITKAEKIFGNIDEFLCQILSQTWKNDFDPHHDRIWRLLLHSLSCLIPSSNLYSYILNYTSNSADDCFKGYFQEKLLYMPQNTKLVRLMPPTVLEWEANNNANRIAVEIMFPDDTTLVLGIHSWTTSEELAKRALHLKGLEGVEGWTVTMQFDDGHITETSGDDYILDVISFYETLPDLISMEETAFPLQYEIRSDNFFNDASRSDHSSMDNFTFGSPNLKKQTPTNRKSSVEGKRLHDSHIKHHIKGGGSMFRGINSPYPIASPMNLQPPISPTANFNPIGSPSLSMMAYGMNPITQQQFLMQQQMQFLLQKSMAQQAALDELVLKSSQMVIPSKNAKQENKLKETLTQSHLPTSVKHLPKTNEFTKSSFDTNQHGQTSTSLPPISLKSNKFISEFSEDTKGSVKMTFDEKRKFFDQNQEQTMPPIKRTTSIPKKIYNKHEFGADQPEPTLKQLPETNQQKPQNTHIPDRKNLKTQQDDTLALALNAKKNLMNKNAKPLVKNQEVTSTPDFKKQAQSESPNPTKFVKENNGVQKKEKRTSVVIHPINIKTRGILYDNEAPVQDAFVVSDQHRETKVTSEVSVNNHPVITYRNVPWKLKVKKEYFPSMGELDNALCVDFIFKQIILSQNSTTPMLNGEDYQLMENFIKHNDTSSNFGKKQFIKFVAEHCKTYFCRIFTVKVSKLSSPTHQNLWDYDMLCVGLQGIVFMNTSDLQQRLITVLHSAVLDVIDINSSTLEICVEDGSVQVTLRKLTSLKKLLNAFKDSVKTNVKYTVEEKHTPSPYYYDDDEDNGDDDDDDTNDYTIDEIVSLPFQKIYEVQQPPDDGVEYSLLTFGKKYFRKSNNVEEMLSYTKTNLTKSIIKFKNDRVNQHATRISKAILKFCHNLKARPEDVHNHVLQILNISQKEDKLSDEIYIQILKQTINNKHRMVVIRAWRLLAFIGAYLTPSQHLVPHLLAHLSDANAKQATSNATAVVLVNLQQTSTYGGRKKLPTVIETWAIANGKSGFVQSFMLPGGASYQFKVTTATVVSHVLESFCREYGIFEQNGSNEFGIFLVMMESDKVSNVLPLNLSTYILDVNSEMKKQQNMFFFMVQRVVWKIPIQFDNVKLVSLLFEQISPDYNDGKLAEHLVTENVDTSKIVWNAALQFVGFGQTHNPTMDEISLYIPQKFQKLQTSTAWRDDFFEHFSAVKSLTSHKARCEFLLGLQKNKFFGSTFFTVDTDAMKPPNSNDVILAVNHNVLYFIDPSNEKVVLRYDIKDITSVELVNAGTMMQCTLTIMQHNNTKTFSLFTNKGELILGILNQHISCKEKTTL